MMTTVRKLSAIAIVAMTLVLTGCTGSTTSTTPTRPSQVVQAFAAMTGFLNQMAMGARGPYVAHYQITDYWGNVIHETVWRTDSGWALQEPDPYAVSPSQEVLRVIVRGTGLWVCYDRRNHWSCMTGPSCSTSLECKTFRSQAAPFELASTVSKSRWYTPDHLYKEAGNLRCIKGTRLYVTGVSSPSWTLCANEQFLPVSFGQQGFGEGSDWVKVTLKALSAEVPTDALKPPAVQFSAPRCRPGSLGVSASRSSGQVGQESELIVFQNIRSYACTLLGYPMTRFLGAPDHSVGPSSIKESSPPPTVVVLSPQGIASTTVWTSNPSYSSSPRTVTRMAWGLQVWFPSWSQRLTIKAPMPIWNRNLYVGTTPVVAGGDPAPL
jgi:hypothetical protein